MREGLICPPFQENNNLLDIFENQVVGKTEEEFEAIKKRWQAEKETMDLTRQRLETCRHAFSEKGNTIRRYFRELADVTETLRRLNMIIEMKQEDLTNSRHKAQSNHPLKNYYQTQVIKVEEDLKQWEDKRNRLTTKK
ncbi:hypothetical protein V7124_19780 [Neobacillus niacini]|uniref:hypothetical protein n=1 Tax=Neobacillus niacini TaxID=86668 RepID=UPI002FFF67C3